MASKKFSSSKYKSNKLLISLIKLSFCGIGIGILAGSLIKSFESTESFINNDSSLIRKESIIRDSIPEFSRGKSSTKSSIELGPQSTNQNLNIEVIPKNKFSANQDNLVILYPLKAANPTKLQLKGLIEAWLDGKAGILAGGKSKVLSKVARKNLVDIVNSQRIADKKSKEFQLIKAKVESLIIKEKTSKRIEVSTKISYEDKRLKLSGEIIEKTAPSTLKINYILGRMDNNWMLIDFFMID